MPHINETIELKIIRVVCPECGKTRLFMPCGPVGQSQFQEVLPGGTLTLATRVGLPCEICDACLCHQESARTARRQDLMLRRKPVGLRERRRSLEGSAMKRRLPCPVIIDLDDGLELHCFTDTCYLCRPLKDGETLQGVASEEW